MMTDDDPPLGPDGNAWFSPGACPDCLARYKKEVWLVSVTIGNPGHVLFHECKVCGYTLPMTYEGFERL